MPERSERNGYKNVIQVNDKCNEFALCGSGIGRIMGAEGRCWEMEERKYKYKAFISYRHVQPDKAIAMKLQKMLENFHLPEKTKKEEPWKIFRDESELPTSSDLSSDIRDALEQSEFLIILYSKMTAQSRWCMEELLTFKRLHNNTNENVITVLVEGTPEEVFPPELYTIKRQERMPDGAVKEWDEIVEPLAANLTSDDTRKTNKRTPYQKLKKEFLRIAAPLAGCGFDDLYRRKQRQKIRRTVIGFTAGLLFTSAIAVFAITSLMRIQHQNEQIMAQNAEIEKKSAEIVRSSEQIKQQQEGLQQNAIELANQAAALELENFDRYAAVKTLLSAYDYEAEPERLTGTGRKILQEALYAYEPSEREVQENCVLTTKGTIDGYSYNEDASLFLAWDRLAYLYVWDTDTGNLVYQTEVSEDLLYGHYDIISIRFLGMDRVLIITEEFVRLVDIRAGTVIWERYAKEQSYSEGYCTAGISEDEEYLFLVNGFRIEGEYAYEILLLRTDTGEVCKTYDYDAIAGRIEKERGTDVLEEFEDELMDGENYISFHEDRILIVVDYPITYKFGTLIEIDVLIFVTLNIFTDECTTAYFHYGDSYIREICMTDSGEIAVLKSSNTLYIVSQDGTKQQEFHFDAFKEKHYNNDSLVSLKRVPSSEAERKDLLVVWAGDTLCLVDSADKTIVLQEEYSQKIKSAAFLQGKSPKLVLLYDDSSYSIADIDTMKAERGGALGLRVEDYAKFFICGDENHYAIGDTDERRITLFSNHQDKSYTNALGHGEDGEYSSDGKYIIIEKESDKLLRTYDAENGSFLAEIDLGAFAPFYYYYYDSGTENIVVNEYSEILFYDVKTGKKKRAIEKNLQDFSEEFVYGCYFSERGNCGFGAGRRGIIKWEGDKASVVYDQSLSEEYLFLENGSMVMSPDGQWILIQNTAKDEATHLLLINTDSKEGSVVAEDMEGNDFFYTDRDSSLPTYQGNAAFRPDGSQFVLAWKDKIRLYDIETGVWEDFAEIEGAVILQLVFTPDGKHLIVTDTEGALYDLDAQSGALLKKLSLEIERDSFWPIEFLFDEAENTLVLRKGDLVSAVYFIDLDSFEVNWAKEFGCKDYNPVTKEVLIEADDSYYTYRFYTNEELIQKAKDLLQSK